MLSLYDIASDRPVLIAGPTASGKSDMALQIVEQSGGVIINADALQVYDNWHVLTARPSPEDQARAKHLLYGHIAFDTPYSVGDWLRDVMDILSGEKRPVIVGGTGLYFAALTEGLAKIPPTPAPIREAADKLLHENGLAVMRHALDTESLERIDVNNPMRVQRAWEVLKA
ncbi:MAG: isopentenyl transferase family protein, partial [Pseudomonadota bacterium]